MNSGVAMHGSGAVDPFQRLHLMERDLHSVCHSCSLEEEGDSDLSLCRPILGIQSQIHPRKSVENFDYPQNKKKRKEKEKSTDKIL